MTFTRKQANFAVLGAAASRALAGIWQQPVPVRSHLPVLAAGAVFGLADWILLSPVHKFRRLGT